MSLKHRTKTRRHRTGKARRHRTGKARRHRTGKRRRRSRSPRKGRGRRVKSAKQPCPGPCPRCEEKITTAQLKKVFTSAKSSVLSEMAKAFNDAYKKFDLNRCLRKAHFFAQVREEIGANAKVKPENLNYSAKKLKTGKPFSYFRRHKKEANLYGRSKAHRANQKAIANRAYANRVGNGNIASGDGWRYRGNGYIQLTFRKNWKNVQKEIDKRYPGSGVDIIKRPKSIEKPKGGMVSAMAYWSSHGLNQKADEGSQARHVNAITRVINSKTHSYANRRKHFQKTKKAFKVASCKRRRNSKGKCVAAGAGPAAKGKASGTGKGPK